jgi:hypothetical protein
MDEATTMTWAQANHSYLATALELVRLFVASHSGQHDASEQPSLEHLAQELDDLARAMDRQPSLQVVVDLFDLSPFERDVLVLCAGIELDARFAPLCAAAHGDAQQAYPTFSLALAALPGAHWSALTPEAPLRHWRLIRIEPDRTLTRAALRVDERLLHYLTGVSHLAEDLAGMVRPVPDAGPLVPSHQAIAREIAATWIEAAETGSLPAVQLVGSDIDGKRAIAAAASQLLGLEVHLMPAAAVPTAPAELDQLVRLWQREAALSDAILLLDCDDTERSDTLRESAIARWIEAGTTGPLFLSSRERRGPWQRPVISFDVDKPTSDEQRAIWHALVDETQLPMNGHVDRLVNQFDLSTPIILAAYDGALGRLASQADDQQPAADAFAGALWDLCRTQARPQLDDLAQRIEAAASWGDLILPERQIEALREIAVHLRQRSRVYEQWGFASKGKRGQGVTALFAGPSGTGKTMAAEVLAQELQLDLYRIDLSAVVSKYIGETEKNLRRVFDAAEMGGAILLFDEADALFGKRSEVKDSHDRHANIEVSYLLQRMEAYRGLAILTTNLKDALDDAFLRRLRFVIEFPFPSAAERARIWRSVFPAATPTRGLDADKLARLDLAGGNIRNIALNAAFLAAEADEPVQMRHLLRAARREFAKLEQPLSAAETRDWVGPGNEA